MAKGRAFYLSMSARRLVQWIGMVGKRKNI